MFGYYYWNWLGSFVASTSVTDILIVCMRVVPGDCSVGADVFIGYVEYSVVATWEASLEAGVAMGTAAGAGFGLHIGSWAGAASVVATGEVSGALAVGARLSDGTGVCPMDAAAAIDVCWWEAPVVCHVGGACADGLAATVLGEALAWRLGTFAAGLGV